MTYAELQARAVADVAARSRQAGSHSFAEAFTRPVMKTAPPGFHSIQEAESEGWTFDPVLGRWCAPAAMRERLHAKEKIAKQLTNERVDSLSVADLRETLKALTGLEASSAVEDVDALRAAVKKHATEVASSAREARKHNIHERSAALTGWTCRACGKPPAVGKRLLQCSRCETVSYCNATCQREHWPQHKSMCKQFVQQRKEAREDKSDVSKFDDVMAWYASVPNLCEGVLCLAWEQRKKSPLIKVQGGINARLAQVECYPRSDWSKIPGDPLGLAQRYAQADFDPDVHYFVSISAGHPGTEDWPCPNPRMRFPLPPQEMDAFVAVSHAKREREKREHHTDEASRANPWVELTGLRKSEMNGKRGIRGAWDAGKQRYSVQLAEGSTVSVRPENLVLCGLTHTGEPCTLR